MSQPVANSVYTVATGFASTSTFIEHFDTRDPTAYDINYHIQQRWFNISSGQEFLLVGFSSENGSFLADWFPIAVPATGGLIWDNVTSSPKQMEVGHGYVTDGVSVTYTLPSFGLLGDVVEVVGNGGISTIECNGGQEVVFGIFSTALGGNLVATKVTDCIVLRCIVPGSLPTFQVTFSQGNWDVN